MKDLQKSRDDRGIAIDRVGVSDLRYPVVVLDKTEKKQHTVANITLSVDLPHHFKGTHMSRFLEVLNRHHGEITMHTVPAILRELQERLEAERAHISLCFPYFIKKAAPVTRAEGMMDYQCAFIGERAENTDDFLLEAEIPVTSLCPCSKEISKYGAHNQRSRVSIRVRTRRRENGMWDFIWIEELIAIAEASASAPLFSLLKRSDEKLLTELAYDNPVFVEDLARDIARKLTEEERIDWFRVRCVNEESIHNHNAFAEITWSRNH